MTRCSASALMGQLESSAATYSGMLQPRGQPMWWPGEGGTPCAARWQGPCQAAAAGHGTRRCRHSACSRQPVRRFIWQRTWSWLSLRAAASWRGRAREWRSAGRGTCGRVRAPGRALVQGWRARNGCMPQAAAACAGAGAQGGEGRAAAAAHQPRKWRSCIKPATRARQARLALSYVMPAPQSSRAEGRSSATSLPCTAACAALPPAGCGWVPLATATADLPPCRRAAASSCTAARPGGPSRSTTEVQHYAARGTARGAGGLPLGRLTDQPGGGFVVHLWPAVCLVSPNTGVPKRPCPCPATVRAQSTDCQQLVSARACGLDGGRRGGVVAAAGQDSPGDERRVKACAVLAQP